MALSRILFSLAIVLSIDYLELSGADELYDLQTDPFEMDNLIDTDVGRRLLPDLTAELARLQRESGYRRDFRGYR